jgi:modification methylase
VSKRKRASTKTSAFGAPGRESHDASEFYNSRLYLGQQKPFKGDHLEVPLPALMVNRFFTKSAEDMHDLPDHSVHLMITSPPYNVRKEYDQDLTLDEYREFLRRVFQETYRVLVTGGRACINIANLGRKPYIPLHAYLIEDMLDLGFLMRGEIIWNKAASASSSTAWGTWCSATNPVLRDIHEYILIFSKESFSRGSNQRKSTIERDDFLAFTKSIWTFPTVSARKIGHPAPFPEELPRRLIDLYSYEDDIILDPFCGSGTSCLAAYNNGRKFVGYDIEEEYTSLAKERLEAAGYSFA